MARATTTAMADGNTTEMAVAICHMDRSNGPQQRGWRWVIGTAGAMAMAMATATAATMAMELETELAKVMAKRWPRQGRP